MVKGIGQPEFGVWVTNGDYVSSDDPFYIMWCLTSETGKLLKEYQRTGKKYYIGKPKSTEAYSSEELEKMGLVGIYRLETN